MHTCSPRARLAVETSLTLINLCRQGEVPVFGPDRLVAHRTSGSSSPTTTSPTTTRLLSPSQRETLRPAAWNLIPFWIFFSATMLLCNQLFLGFTLCLD